jgi:hypothetical protein
MRSDDTLAKARGDLGQNGLSRLINLGLSRFGRLGIS